MLVVLTAASCMKGDFGGYYDGYNGGTEPSPSATGDQFDALPENKFILTADQPVSSFSVDADGASFAYMRNQVNRGYLPDPASVRIEEFLNYFTFDYPDPTGAETLAINAETGACPWAPEHRLIRLGLKGKPLTDSEIPAANYILLIDTSGSMSGSDRIDLLKNGLVTMLDYMKPEDRIAVITYSGSVNKLLESTILSEGKARIASAIRSLIASGTTAGGEAMKMAYEEAVEHYIPGGNNRIIMCTDGDFNVGVSSTDALVEMVESYLDKGIYLSIMGFGTGNYQDARMESLSNHGNGTYTYIDCEDEMMKVFVHERSHFYSVANDTKCQVTFRPEAVESYRLLGYENRVLSSEDFENDKKDAGEIGAGQTITALYEVVPAAGWAEGSPAAFDVRYKKALGEDSRLLRLDVPKAESASENLQFAAGVTAIGLTLRDSAYKGSASVAMGKELISGAVTFDPGAYRAAFLKLLDAKPFQQK